MEAVSYAHSAKQAKRIKRFIENPDSNSGVLTQPKVIEAGETVTIKSGRQAILADTVVEGDLVIEAGGEVFVPAGANFSDLDQRVDRLETLQIGAILNGYTIFDNCIVAFGGEFNRADYPKLWAYLQANPTLVKTQAQWQTENTANGMCGFYSDGNGTTTFRVPNLDKAFLRLDSRGVGSWQKGSASVVNDSYEGHVFGIETNGALNNQLVRESAGLDKANFLHYTNIRAVYAGTSTGYLNDFMNDPTWGGGITRPQNIAVLPLIVAK